MTVRFPRPVGSDSYNDVERQMKDMKWEKDKIVEDMKREQYMLDAAKFNYNTRRMSFSSV